MTRFVELELRVLTRGEVKTGYGPSVGDVWGAERPVQVNPAHIASLHDISGDDAGCVITFSDGRRALLEDWSAADLAAVLDDDVRESLPDGPFSRAALRAASKPPLAKAKGKGK